MEEIKVINEETQNEAVSSASPEQNTELATDSATKTYEIADSETSTEEEAADCGETVKEESEEGEAVTTGTEETKEETEEAAKEETKEETTELTNMEAVVEQGLPIMAAGMMGIFVVIGIIIVSISLLAKLGDGNGFFSKGVKALFSKKK